MGASLPAHTTAPPKRWGGGVCLDFVVQGAFLRLVVSLVLCGCVLGWFFFFSSSGLLGVLFV